MINDLTLPPTLPLHHQVTQVYAVAIYSDCEQCIVLIARPITNFSGPGRARPVFRQPKQKWRPSKTGCCSSKLQSKTNRYSVRIHSDQCLFDFGDESRRQAAVDTICIHSPSIGYSAKRSSVSSRLTASENNVNSTNKCDQSTKSPHSYSRFLLLNAINLLQAFIKTKTKHRTRTFKGGKMIDSQWAASNYPRFAVSSYILRFCIMYVEMHFVNSTLIGDRNCRRD